MSRRFRPRVWMLLVGVVLVALAIEGTGIGPRWRDYRRKAAESALTVRSAESLARECESEAARLRASARGLPPAEAAVHIHDAEILEDRASDWRRLADWNGRVEEVYRDASRRPWGPPPRVPTFVAAPRRRSIQVPR